MDLKELKSRIHNEERIEELLEYIGCQNIKSEQGGTLFTACLPDGDNPRSVQIKNNEALTVNIRSRGIEGSDIFGLVGYIIFDCSTNEERIKCIPKSKKWICERLNYDLNVSKYVNEFENWHNNLEKKDKKIVRRTEFNPILPEVVLQQYINYPYLDYLHEGISYETQVLFEISFDLFTERVIIPIRDRNGGLIGTKGRYVGKDPHILSQKKYLYVISCNKSLELYNYFRSFPHILSRKIVFIFEGEKSCMKAHQMNYPNCVAIGGDSISSEQANLLNELDVKKVLCFDKDKEKKFIMSQVELLDKQNVYIMLDINNLLDYKCSPVDISKEIFEKLIRQYTYKV